MKWEVLIKGDKLMMRKSIILSIILLFSIVGCSQNESVNFDENTTIVVEKRIGDEGSHNYEIINESEDEASIQKIINILAGAKWVTNVEFEMVRETDYKLNSDFHIWLTPKSNMLEIINIDNRYYVRLPSK